MKKNLLIKVLAARANALMKRVDGMVSKNAKIVEYAGLKVNLASSEVLSITRPLC